MERKTTYRSAKGHPADELRDAVTPPDRAREETREGMVRTQIYLSRVQHDHVQTEASRRGEPMAAVIRSYIEDRMNVPADAWENNALLSLPADPDFEGHEDGAINHDHYVYGGPKKWVRRGGRWVEAPPLPEDYYTNAESAAAYDRTLEETL